MGNIKSFCCRDNISELDEGDERARILSDNNGSTNSLYNNSSNPSQDDLSYGSMNNGVGGGYSGGSKSIEQSALDKIYQKLAANVIDVAPGESMVIQTAEFIERQKAYQARLSQSKANISLKLSNSKNSRNPNSSTMDSSSANTSSTTRVNKSISTAGANLTAFNQLNTTNGTTSSSGNLSNATNSHYHNGGISSYANTTSSSGIIVGGGSSSRHLNADEKPQVDYEPISNEDIQLINEICDRSVMAIKGFKVVSDEPVVTTFEP